MNGATLGDQCAREQVVAGPARKDDDLETVGLLGRNLLANSAGDIIGPDPDTGRAN